MSVEQPRRDLNQRIQAALDELQGLLRARFPEATFSVFANDDPDGIYLAPTIDREDTDEVLEVVLDRLLELQVDQGLPIYVTPVLPPERVADQLRRRAPRTLPPALLHAFRR